MRHLCKLLLVAPLCAALAGSTWAKEEAPSSLGKKVDEFSLQDFRGKQHRRGCEGREAGRRGLSGR
jgi:hypothetical protein